MHDRNARCYFSAREHQFRVCGHGDYFWMGAHAFYLGYEHLKHYCTSLPPFSSTQELWTSGPQCLTDDEPRKSHGRLGEVAQEAILIRAETHLILRRFLLAFTLVALFPVRCLTLSRAIVCDLATTANLEASTVPSPPRLNLAAGGSSTFHRRRAHRLLPHHLIQCHTRESLLPLPLARKS